MKTRSERKIYIPLSIELYDVAVVLYFCVLFAHQRENIIDTVLRYGSLFLLLGVWFLTYVMPKLRERNAVIRIPIFLVWILTLFCYMICSLLWSIDADSGYRILFNIARMILACTAVLPRFRTREELCRLLAMILFSLIYAMGLLMLRLPSGALGVERIGEEIGQHSNEIGRMAAVGGLLSLFFFTVKRKFRWSYLVLLAGFLFCSLMTGSKNAILIMMFQIMLYWILISGQRMRVLKICFGAGILILMFWLIMTNAVLYNLVGNRIENMLYIFVDSSQADGSTRERIFFMQTAWGLFTEQPVLGVGLNNFAAYLQSIHYENAVYSHSGFLEILSTLGIVGFVLYYSLYLLVAVRLFPKALRRDRMGAVLFCLCLRILVFDLTAISAYIYSSYFYLMAAWCYTVVDIREGGSA